MRPLEESENGDIQFQWGKRRGISLANKKVQFYESFIYDEQSYSLYDNVFLFKDDESEPYIGKILKIWEQPQDKRRVKILWFFRPADIMNYLGDYPVSEKELFLASGEGAGVSNVNSLEAIAGKCSVICTSTDEKNIQPSGTALANADFIFSRFFDVGSCTLSEKVPENIAGIELKFLLNQPENLKLDHSVKLEAVDLGVAFVDTPIKKLEQSDDFVKLPLDIQVASDLTEKKLTMKSDDGYLDNYVPSKVRPVDGLIKHTHADQEKNDLITKKRKYVSDEDCLNDDSIYVLKASSQLAEPAEVKDNLLDALPQKPNSTGLVMFPYSKAHS